MTFINQELTDGGFKFTMSGTCSGVVHDDENSPFRKFWLNDKCQNFKWPESKHIGSLKICDVIIYEESFNHLYLIENKQSQQGNRLDGTEWGPKNFHDDIMPKFVGTINSLFYVKLFYGAHSEQYKFYNKITNCQKITMILNFDQKKTIYGHNLWVQFNELYLNHYRGFFKNNFNFLASSPSRINGQNYPFKIMSEK